jgi:hypothetical protein
MKCFISICPNTLICLFASLGNWFQKEPKWESCFRLRLGCCICCLFFIEFFLYCILHGSYVLIDLCLPLQHLIDVMFLIFFNVLFVWFVLQLFTYLCKLVVFVWCSTFVSSIFIDLNIDPNIRSSMLSFGSVFKPCVLIYYTTFVFIF